MTTIACNLKEIAADSRVTHDGIASDVYTGMKLFVAGSAIYATQGENCLGQMLGIEWLQQGAIVQNRPVPPKGADWNLLELSPAGMALYNDHLEREVVVADMFAIGSGRKVALYCMKYLGMSPAQAVFEACKVCNYSAPPVYHATLKERIIREWNPTKKGRK